MERYYEYAMEYETVYNELLHNCDMEKVVDELCAVRWYSDIRMKRTLMDIGVFKLNFFDIKDYSFNWDKLKKFGLLDKNGGFLLEGGYGIPIRDIEGYLLGIVAYFPGRNTANKYRTASGRYFHKGLSLFNIDNAVALSEDLSFVYVVEGIFDSIAMRSVGLPCVALQGSEITQYKRELLKLFRKNIAIPDNDAIGKQTLYKWQLEGNVTYVEITGSIQIGDEVKAVKDTDDLIKYYSNMEDILLEYKSSKNRYEKLEL